jgi:hypothetical protein
VPAASLLVTSARVAIPVIELRSPAHRFAWKLLEFGAVLDPETQPCYAANMPDPDSRPLAASLNDLNMMSCLHVTPLIEGAVAHRFTEGCNEFGLAIGFGTTVHPADTLLMSQFDRGNVEDCGSAVGRDARVSDSRNSRGSGHQSSVSDSIIDTLRALRRCCGAKVPAAMVDFPEKAM